MPLLQAVVLTGDPAVLVRVRALISVAGLRERTPGRSASDPVLWIHAGPARNLAPAPQSPGVLMVPAVEDAELALLAQGMADVVIDTAPPEELVARFASASRRAAAQQEAAGLHRSTTDLIGHLSDGVVVVDSDGYVLQINPPGAAMLGWPEETRGKRLFELARPADKSIVGNLIRTIRGGERLRDFDVDAMLHDGRRAVFSISSGPLRSSEGRAVISFRDVTAARNTEKELRRTSDFLQHLIDGSSDAIVASDMRGRLVVFNRAAERLFGVDATKAREDMSVIDLYPQGGAREMMRLLRASAGGRIEAVRAYGSTQSGELVPIEVAASLVKMNGVEVATVGLLRDLRERVRVEGELARTRTRLIDAEKQAAVTALAGATAHELNQPLTVISGFVELLLKRVDDSQRRPMEAIAFQTDRMAEIVRRIAKLTRVETMAYPGDRHIADLEKSADDRVVPINRER